METSSRISKYFIFFLCSLIIIAPLPLGSNRIWAWSILEFAVFSLACFHLAYCAKHEKPILSFDWQKTLLIPIVVMLVYLLLQVIGVIPGIETVDAYQTTHQLLKTLTYLIFVLLLSEYCKDERMLRWVVFSIILSGCFQAFYGSFVYLLDLDVSPVFHFAEGDKARGTFVYQNHFANYLALCLAIAVGWLISELNTQRQAFEFRQAFLNALSTMFSRKLILRLAIILMIIGLILSRSRMGNAGFFTALIVVSVFAIFCYRRPPILLKPLVISIIILDLIIVGSIFGVEKVKQRIEDTSFASETRDLVVIDSMPIIKDNWLTGTGGGSFYTIFPSYQPRPYSGFYDHAHNEYIQFSIEYGVIISAMLGLWVLYGLYLACKTMHKRNNKFYKGVAFGSAMAIVHMCIHNMVDFNLQSPANTLLFLTILTLCWLSYNLPSDLKKRPRRHRGD
ncbi:O-antigen ligase family protein [Shewanella sp. 1_MG-2023]|uniref:O-antigen ligase family protein n=1 Tax=unclassified Shewanella TaxID=196818 RepID=UPI0026E485AE|nr:MULTISPECIES: O-antigen ligase family protein [unclassified Shewanella]MDO6613509.1 O-antigen ligase family protein [Shewanella sp. 7_MG-2023]MDO6773339.1 O-antigen ligase family protein [Shewanella sp. 2_MG-2023]MDO6795990.1 O-antigen ligase family protein [Shewanella sp. 1_MG-2023]